MAHTHTNKIRTSTGEKIFTVFNYAFITVLCLVMLYPFWHVVMQSFSSMEETLKGGVFLYPKGLSVWVMRFPTNSDPRTYIFSTLAPSPQRRRKSPARRSRA